MTSNIKYIGMDVHTESISLAVRNSVGKVVMESVIETKASMILQFIDGLRGDLQVTFEEGTSAAWLYDLLKPHVTKLVVCDPRKNKSMREGNQNDKIDARRLAELLRLNHLTPVYHGEHGLRTLKELVRSYLTVTKDLARVMTRVKAFIAVGPFRVAASRSMPDAIGRSGSGRSPNRECAGAQNFITNSSMPCAGCARKRDGIYSRRARNTRSGNNSVGFPRLARSGRRCC
jgi:Transposase